jgi:glutamyl-tRNA synthetase
MRVRFAPSPTGALHIGGARTALYNWLLARGQGGEMVLRIEDTDRERSTPENVEQIFEALRWLELDWDGEPVFQSQRAGRHAEVVEQLLAGGHAYRSTAGPDDVRAYKEQHGNRGFRGTDEGTGAVRLRVPDEGSTTVVDVIRGETQFANALQDDLVIARADGTPVYHLAVVVDDHDAGITHVVRGADHYSNAPKHVLIQQAMGAGTPLYAHLPLLHGPDGKKLSKRHGAASVQELRDRGYLPEAVRNYLALLGWGYDEETTFFTTQELKRHFSLEQVSKSPAVFDEQKLRWMNGRYVRELALDDLTARLESLTGRTGLRDAVAITQEKISTREVPHPRKRRGGACSGALGAIRAGRAVEPRSRRSGAARGRRAVRDEGEAGVPAAAGRAHGHYDLSRHLRDGRAGRARKGAGAYRQRARRAPGRLIDTESGAERLNRSSTNADRC